MPFTGGQGLAGFGKESQWGEAASATTYVEVVSETIASSNALISPEGAAGTKLRKRLLQGVRAIEGELAFLPQPGPLGQAFALMFGEPETTELAEGVYQHVFAGEPEQVPSVTVEVNLGGYKSRQITGCKAERLRLGFPQRQVLECSVGLVGKQESLIAPSSYELSDENPLSFVGGSAEFPVGTPCADLSGGEVVFFRELLRGWATLGSGLEIAKLPEGRRSTSCRLSLDFEDESAYEAFLGAEWRSLKLQFEGDELASGYKASCTIEIGKFLIDSPGLHLSGPDGLLVYDLACEAVADTSLATPTEVTVTLVNGTASY